MLTMLWLYLVTNNIIKLEGSGNIVILLTLFYVLLDYALVWAICNKLNKGESK